MGVYGGQPKWFSRLTWEFLTHLGEVLSDNKFDLEATKRAAAIDSSQVPPPFLNELVEDL